MIRITEYVLIRIQDRFGVPRWWLIRTCMNLTVLSFVLSATVRGELDLWMLAWAVFIVSTWVFNCDSFRQDQKIADERQQIVSTTKPQRGVNGFLAYLLAALSIVYVVTQQHMLLTAGMVFMSMGMALAASHTFPMVGPTFKEKLKNLFTFRRAAEAKESA